MDEELDISTLPEDLLDHFAVADRERQITSVEVWLPVEFLPPLKRWAEREGASVELHLARFLCEAINRSDFAHVVEKDGLPAAFQVVADHQSTH